MNKLPVAPIQDEKGILHFSQEGRSYTLNVNSKEERERVKNEINANSLTEYEWFKEKRGKSIGFFTIQKCMKLLVFQINICIIKNFVV